MRKRESERERERERGGGGRREDGRKGKSEATSLDLLSK
jgi:hypothetical protein